LPALIALSGNGLSFRPTQPDVQRQQLPGTWAG